MIKGKVPLEHTEQVAFFNWLEHDLPFVYARAFAVPNGSHKSPAAAVWFRDEGLKSGVPDIFIMLPNGWYHCLVIEMKRQKGGSISPQQKIWINQLRHDGYKVEVCKGFEKAKEVTLQYIAESKV